LQIPAKWDFKVSKPIRFFALLRMTLTKATAAKVISSAAALISWWAMTGTNPCHQNKGVRYLSPCSFYKVM